MAYVLKSSQVFDVNEQTRFRNLDLIENFITINGINNLKFRITALHMHDVIISLNIIMLLWQVSMYVKYAIMKCNISSAPIYRRSTSYDMLIRLTYRILYMHQGVYRPAVSETEYRVHACHSNVLVIASRRTRELGPCTA